MEHGRPVEKQLVENKWEKNDDSPHSFNSKTTGLRLQNVKAPVTIATDYKMYKQTKLTSGRNAKKNIGYTLNTNPASLPALKQ